MLRPLLASKLNYSRCCSTADQRHSQQLSLFLTCASTIAVVSVPIIQQFATTWITRMLPTFRTLQCFSPAGPGAGKSLAAAMQQLLPSCSSLSQPRMSFYRTNSNSTRPKEEAPEAGPGPRTRSMDQATAAGETLETNDRVQVTRHIP
jgi:hypothetical protein